MPWIFKTEPSECSIDDIQHAGEKGVVWEGIRNYQARNFLRDQVKQGDKVIIHHSSCAQVGLVGLATICRSAYPDPSQFDTQSRYVDSTSHPAQPRWLCVDVRFELRFPHILTLPYLRQQPELAAMTLLKKGNRLSVMPLTESEFALVLSIARQKDYTS